MLKYVKLFEEQTKAGSQSRSFQELVDTLYSARDSSWAEGFAKTLFNTKDSVRDLALAIVNWKGKNPNADPKLLKAAITILFRESKASAASFISPKEIIGGLHNLFGGEHSQGYAQVKPSTAKQYGIDQTDLYTYEGSLEAAYKILKSNYEKAKKYYSGQTVSAYQNNKLVEIPAIDNDAALHMAIAAHNAGSGLINQWCMTNLQGIANICSIDKRTPNSEKPDEVAITDKNKKIPNYFANIGGVHRYIPQFKVAYDLLSKVPQLLGDANLFASIQQSLTQDSSGSPNPAATA